MRQLSLSVRLILIMAVAILVLQVIAVGVQVTRDDGFNLSGIRPAFAREVAGFTRLFDRLPPLRRALALDILNAGRFTLAISDTPPTDDAAGAVLTLIGEAIRSRLADEGLDPDRLTVLFQRDAADGSTGRGPLMRLVGRHIVVAVALRSGGYLVIDPGNDVDSGVYGNLLAILAGLLGIVVIAVAIFFARRETRPLRALVGHVEAFARSAVPQPLAPSGAPELRRLIAATNDMQRQIAALINNRALILAGLSHDLRTQVTRLRLRLELLDSGPARDKAIADIEAMQSLIEETLEFAAAGSAADGGRTDLAQVLDRFIADQAQAHPGLVSLSAPAGPIPLAIAETPLRRVLDNLVNNAIAYGERADLSVSVAANEVSIAIADRGPGIPPPERQQVFEPFYRLETSRNRKSGGTGLGLAIVQQIVSRHHGRIEISDRAGGGAVFTLTLPRAAL